MNTSLLACIRGASVRIRSAELAERERRPIRFNLMRPLRLFRELSQVSKCCCADAVYYLPGFPSPNSKSAHVYDELLAAGVPRSAVSHLPASAPGNGSRAWRLLSRLPWALLLVCIVVFRQRRFDRLSLQIILGREAYRRWLRKCPALHPIIISDVSPGLHMLWSAAAVEGNRAIWWQDDFHHTFPLPYPIRAAAVLNLPGLRYVEARSAVALIAARPTSPPRALKRLPSKPVVGLATNASFVADRAQLQLLATLSDQLGTTELHLRLHPNSQLTQEKFAGTPARVASVNESMEAFADRIDLAIVGNTAAQLWLIRNGIPVVHVPGLDKHGYDLYGYVQRGLVLGAPNLAAISLRNASDFYRANEDAIRQGVRDYTTLCSRKEIGGLEAFEKFHQLYRSENEPGQPAADRT